MSSPPPGRPPCRRRFALERLRGHGRCGFRISTRRLREGEAMGNATEMPPAVPDAVAAAWGVRDRTRRKGPKPALTLSRIVRSAIRMADADGLEAISMARVAAKAGTAPMSLYRHVSGKEQLLELMGDAAWGAPPPPPAPPTAPGESWREGPSRWAWAMR